MLTPSVRIGVSILSERHSNAAHQAAQTICWIIKRCPFSSLFFPSFYANNPLASITALSSPYSMSLSIIEQQWTIAHLECAFVLILHHWNPRHPFPIYGEQRKRPKFPCIPFLYIRHYFGNGKYTSTPSSPLTNCLIPRSSQSRFWPNQTSNSSTPLYLYLSSWTIIWLRCSWYSINC